MSIVALGSMGTTRAHSSGTTLSLQNILAAAAGNLVILAIAKRNSGAADGPVQEVIAVEDGGRNGWMRLAEHSNSNSAAGAGIVTSLWASVLSAPIPAHSRTVPSLITMTFDAAVTGKVAGAYLFSMGAANTVVHAAASLYEVVDGTNWGALTFAAALPSAEYLTIRTVGLKASAAGGESVTPTWTQLVKYNTNGTSDVDVSVWAEFIIATSTGEASSVSSGVTKDNVSVAVALQEYVVPSEQFLVHSL